MGRQKVRGAAGQTVCREAVATCVAHRLGLHGYTGVAHRHRGLVVSAFPSLRRYEPDQVLERFMTVPGTYRMAGSVQGRHERL